MLKISIIVPVYNTSKYLEKCFDSIINQTYQDIELIIVNDGSHDDSEIIIYKYLKKYPNKIKYFKKKNTGIADTRNYAIGKISGKYFIFVDSDDYIEKNLLELLFKQLNNNSLDIIKYKMQQLDSNNNLIKKIDGPIFEEKTGQEAFNLLCFKDKIIDTPCLYLFNTSFYKKNKFKFESNKSHEDFGLIPLIIIKSNKFLSTEIYGYNYMYRQDSITKDTNYNKLLIQSYDLLFHYDNMIKEIIKINLNKKTINNLKQYYTNSILLAAKKLNKTDQKKYIQEIKKRRLIKNIKVKNIKQLFKKILLKINIKLYLILK